MADNIFDVLSALTALNDGVTSPSTPFGAPPQAGLGGATTAYQQAQATAPQTAPPPAVYVGPQVQEIPTGHPTRSDDTETIRTDKTRDPFKMLEKFAKASPSEQRRMALLLSLGGYAGEGSFEKLIVESFDMTLGDVIDAYDKLLYEASTQYVMNGKKITPDQILTRAIAYKMPTGANWDGTLSGVGAALGNLGMEIEGVTEAEDAMPDEEDSVNGVSRKPKPFVGTKTTKSTSTVRDVMDPADAKALTRAMLQRELGRDPTEEEFVDFIGAVQYAQKTNPSVSTTKNSYRYEKDKYAPGGSRMVEQSSNTVTREGIGSEGLADIALQKARSNPNWAEWQAVGTYAPALFEALGATVAGR